MIIYNKKGTIIAQGDLEENDTHFILNGDRYFDKNGCGLLENDDLSDINDYEVVNGVLIKKNKQHLTNDEFNTILGDSLAILLELSKTDTEIEFFKYRIDHCGNKINTQSDIFITGINILKQRGLIDQETYDKFNISDQQ